MQEPDRVPGSPAEVGVSPGGLRVQRCILRIETSGSGGHDHCCWAYTGDAGRCEALASVLDAGVRNGERVLLIGTDRLWADLERLSVAPAFERGDQLVAMSPAVVYDVDSNERQVELLGKATSAALELGFTGLRVASDATSLDHGRVDTATMLRWELVIDQMMSVAPISGTCMYDTASLPPSDLALVAGAHPQRHGVDAACAVYSSGGGVVVDGDIDLASAPAVAELLTAMPEPMRAGAAIDLSRCAFVDLAGLRALLGSAPAGYRAERGLRVVHAPDAMRRVVDVLDTPIEFVTPS